MDTDVQEPYDLPVTISIGEDALKAVAEANSYNSWQIECMGNNIANIIKHALAEGLANQLPHATYNSSDLLARAIQVTVNDGVRLIERAKEVNGPIEQEYDVTIRLGTVIFSVTAEDENDARDHAYNNWRDLLDTDDLYLGAITNVELDEESE